MLYKTEKTLFDYVLIHLIVWALLSRCGEILFLVAAFELRNKLSVNHWSEYRIFWNKRVRCVNIQHQCIFVNKSSTEWLRETQYRRTWFEWNIALLRIILSVQKHIIWIHIFSNRINKKTECVVIICTSKCSSCVLNVIAHLFIEHLSQSNHFLLSICTKRVRHMLWFMVKNTYQQKD